MATPPRVGLPDMSGSFAISNALLTTKLWFLLGEPAGGLGFVVTIAGWIKLETQQMLYMETNGRCVFWRSDEIAKELNRRGSLKVGL